VSCARGQGDHALQAGKQALHRDRPSAPPCLAHATRRLWAGGASVLQQALRPPTLAHTPLALAPPSPVLLTRFTVATPGTQDTDRRLLPLPPSWPGKALWRRGTPLRTAIPVLALHPSSGRP
jgi:hypothetical protein